MDAANAAARALTGFGAATVHEAAGRRGAVDHRIRPLRDGYRLCAPILTVSTIAGSNLLIHQALAQAPIGWALAVSTSQAGEDFGYWGDLMTRAAEHAGLAGIVIDGCVRDAAAIRDTDLPVFSRGVCLRGTIKVPDGTIGAAISLGGVAVRTGDVVVGDDDGVVVIPRDDAKETALHALARDRSEAEIMRKLDEGETLVDIFGWGSGPEAIGDPRE